MHSLLGITTAKKESTVIAPKCFKHNVLSSVYLHAVEFLHGLHERQIKSDMDIGA